MTDGKPRSVKQKYKGLRDLFPLCDCIRTWEISHKIVIFCYLLSAVFYLLPLLMAVYARFGITSYSNTLIAILTNLTSKFSAIVEDSLSAGLISGTITLMIVGLAINGKNLLPALRENKEGISTRLSIFRLSILFFRSYMFPLTNFLTIIAIKQIATNPAISLLSFLNFCGISFVNFCLEQTLISIDFKKQHSFDKIANFHDGWNVLFKIIISNLFLVCSNAFLMEIFLLLAAMTINFYNLYFVLFSVKYRKEEAQRVHTVVVMFEFVVLVACLTLFIFPLNILKENLDIFIINILFFGCWAVRNYTNDRNSRLIFVDIADLKTENEAYVFVFQIMKISLARRELEFVKPYLLSHHFRTCRDISCFCSNCSEQQIFKLAKDHAFMNKFLTLTLEKVRQVYPKSLRIFSLYCYYRLQQDPYFSNISCLIRRLIRSKPEMSLCDDFLIYLLQGIVKEQIEEQGSLSVENILLEETKKQELKENVGWLVENLSKKYKNISQEIVRLDEVATVSDKINRNIRNIETIWREHSKTESYSLELDSLFIFYFDKIIPSPLESKKLKIVAIQKQRKIVCLEGFYLKNKQLAMHSPRACVLESLFDDSLGTVVNASDSVWTVLGYEKSQIVGHNINEFMPSYFARGHRQVIDTWLHRESFKFQHDDMYQSFFIDKNCIAFSCLNLIKIHSLGSSLKICKLLIRDNDRDFLLLSQDGRIEGIGTRLLELGVFSIHHLHKNILSFSNDNFLNPTRWQEKVTATICPNNIIPHAQQQSSEESFEDVIFQCRVRKHMGTIGGVGFWAVKFSSVKKTEFFHTLVNMTVKISSQAIKSAKSCSVLMEERNNDESESSIEGDPLEEFNEENSQNLGDYKSQLNRIVIHLKESTCRLKTIPLSSRKWSTIIIFSTILAGILLMYTIQAIFYLGFQSVSKTIAEGTLVGSNSQILELLYNNALMGQSYCQAPGQEQRCTHILTSSKILLDEFYGSFVGDIEEYAETRAWMTKTILHQQYRSDVSINFGGETLAVSAMQFLQNFYLWLRVTNDSPGGSPPEGARAINLLFQNWEVLKKLNEGWIKEHENVSLQEQSAIFAWIVALSSGSMVMALIYFSTLKRYYSKGVSNRQEILQLYRNVGIKTASTFSKYFASIQHQNAKAAYPKEDFKRTHDGMTPSDPKQTRFIIFLIFFSIASPFYLFSVFEPFSIFSPAQDTIQITRSLLESQNYLLQSYLSLKTFYMGYNFSKTQTEMEFEIIGHLNETELDLSKVIERSISLFQGDSTIDEDLNRLVSENACTLVQSHLSKWSADYCRELAARETLDKGVMTTLYALQRSSLSAMVTLRDFQGDKSSFFMTAVFSDLDDSLIYIFRVYRLIEERIVEHLEKQISNRLLYLTLSNILDGFMCVVLLAYWTYSSKKEQEEASNLYGYALQLPEWILAKRQVIQRLKEVLHLKLQ